MEQGIYFYLPTFIFQFVRLMETSFFTLPTAVNISVVHMDLNHGRMTRATSNSLELSATVLMELLSAVLSMAMKAMDTIAMRV